MYIADKATALATFIAVHPQAQRWLLFIHPADNCSPTLRIC